MKIKKPLFFTTTSFLGVVGVLFFALWFSSFSALGADQTGVATASPCSESPVSEGFCTDFYTNKDLTGSPVETDVIDGSEYAYDWRNGSNPIPSIPSNNFSMHGKGQFSLEQGTYTFSLTTRGEGVWLEIDGNRVLDEFSKNHWDKTLTHTIALSEGVHTIEVAQRAGWNAPAVKLTWKKQLEQCTRPQGTFCSEYYDSIDLKGNLKVVENENKILHDWTGGQTPGGGLESRRFSARWKGTFDFDYGKYTFVLQQRGGARVWIDNFLAVNSWEDQWQGEKSHTIDLVGKHDITVEYFAGWNAGKISLSINKQGTPNPSPETPSDPEDPTPETPSDPEDPTPETPSDPKEPQGQPSHSLGMNIHQLIYWSPEWPLTDLFPSSSSWLTQCNGCGWDTREQSKLNLDANGWVRSLPDANDTSAQYRSVSALFFQGNEGKHPGGQYTVLYDGEGTLEYQFAVKNEALSVPGRHVIDVPQNPQGMILKITATDPHRTGNYIRNIRVIMPGGICDNDPFSYSLTGAECATSFTKFSEQSPLQRFHPLFLSDMRSYHGIRFMDFFRTNTNTLENWSDRPKMNDAHWQSEVKGAPIELALELSNRLQENPWVNIPTRANDEYVRRFAQLAKDQLDPNLSITVEYSNEIWNTAFPAGNWVQQQAEALWTDLSISGYTKRINWFGKRTAEICSIWKEVWSDQPERVICAMGTQASSSWAGRQSLECPLWNGQCAKDIDALAIAPYFGGYLGNSQFESAVESWTQEADGGLSKLFTELSSGGLLYNPTHEPAWQRSPQRGALDQSFSWIQNYASLADEFDIDLIAYEGGQHLVGVGAVQNNERISNLFIAANRDARMGDLYSQYLKKWYELGGKHFSLFMSVTGYSKWGSFGVKEYQTQATTPKQSAIDELLQENTAGTLMSDDTDSGCVGYIGQNLPSGTQVFASNSPWNTPISATAVVDPNSDVMIQNLSTALTNLNRNTSISINTHNWSAPMFVIDAASAPKTDIYASKETFHESVDPDRNGIVENVPLPNCPELVFPDPKSDRHMILVDPKLGTVWEFAGFQRGTRNMASRVAIWDLHKTGVGTPFSGKGWWAQGVTGEGTSYMAGLIKKKELEEGALNHALFVIVPEIRQKISASVPHQWEVAAPFGTRTDGKSLGAGYPLAGHRIQLKPDIDLSSFNLSEDSLVVARALQTYGAVVSDKGGAFALKAQVLDASGNGVGWEDTDIDLSSIPLSAYQFLKPEAVVVK